MKDLILFLMALVTFGFLVPGVAHAQDGTPTEEVMVDDAMTAAPEANEPVEAPPQLDSQASAPEPCATHDRSCIIETLYASAGKIERAEWRDQVYRELAKTLAFDGDIESAVIIIEKIQSNDTKAMTIRGIGMTLADSKPPKEKYDAAIELLRGAAEKIKDPPSYAIALTYIAMSQAFAGDNEGAWATAGSMKNDALRHKAYGETAEIQAENGDFNSAMRSIELIQNGPYQNKSLTTVTKILADRQMLGEASQAARAITDPYMQAESLQYILDTQKPRDIPHQ